MEGITGSISVISYPLCFGKISTKYDITTLCVDVTTLGICLTSFTHCIHSITPNNAIYDVTSTSRITSHPCIRHCTHCIFAITTSPLISHPLLNDITPTFWVTSYALYITMHQILMSSHYCTYVITTTIYETTSSM